MAAASDGAVGTVRLLASAWTLDALTRRALPELLAAHPRLNLRLVAGQARSPMHAEATVSLWFDAEPRETEFTVRLGEVAFAAYRHRDDTRDPEVWATIVDEARPVSHPMRATERARPKGSLLRLSSTEPALVAAMVKAGLGRAIIPMALAENDPDLVRVAEGPPEFVRTLHLHAHPDTVQMMRVQAVIRWLRESFAVVFGTIPVR